MLELSDRISEAVAAIRKATDRKIDIGLILGSGLGILASEIENPIILPFKDIPHFPVSTVAGHDGALYIGTLEGKAVAVFKGRIHYYEGYTMEQVTFPVRLLRALGASVLIVTNAVGGINETYRNGDLVLISDHLNLMGTNPLLGPNDDKMGPRFQDMVNAYDRRLRELAHEVARDIGVEVREGVYTGVSGPSYETRSEIRYMRRIGGDTVGMSTVPEVIVARHAGLRVLGISCVTDVLHGDYEEVSHEEVLEVAREAGPRFIRLVRAILGRLPAGAAEGVSHASR